jgi:hypothetical protein
MGRRIVPLAAVPYMGNAGRLACDEAGVGWIDLSGNARIVTGGTRVIIDGRPNRFRSAGRPPSLFAPKSSRIVRWLLMHSEKPLTQREIARATDMDEGFVSLIVSRLQGEGYIVRDSGRAVRSRDPALLLNAWHEAYTFSRHEVHRGHAAARSGDALLRFVCDTLAAQQVVHAVTGPAAAWVYLRFATFRVVTVHLSNDPSPMLLEQLGCREDARGANLWLVVPDDEIQADVVGFVRLLLERCGEMQ